ncbi:hypothetical protein CFC21_075202 [Triticum aestivum]|uniref:F-box domain-containing protein n=2 Tax=Triticum aestivum TaxID=4565 RepID=A0A9R1HPH2_WHEAT|nr:hypothetical protein CFC21_075202 [Triticum aestivum]
MKQSRKESGQEVPEECLAKVIGLTSPADACRATAVSAAFQSAADSDAVWERFLPLDCDAVLERAVHLVDSSSKKELFMDLSDDHVLLDGGKRSFGLHRSSGAKCYMLSVSEMGIAWVTADLYWIKRSDPDSRNCLIYPCLTIKLRFSKVAELMSVCWFSISDRISSKELSPGTQYAAYLVYKLTQDASGLSSPRQISFIEVGGQLVGSIHPASLHPCDRCSCATRDGESSSSSTTSTTNVAAVQVHEHMKDEGGLIVRYPRQRVDGWLEFEIGDFHTGDEAAAAVDVLMVLQELEELQWKKGLIIEGIEIRPRN